MRMDEGMDTGDILLQTEIFLSETMRLLRRFTTSSLPSGAQLSVRDCGEDEEGNVSPIRQDHSKATYAPLLKKEDGRIDWTKEAREIDRQVRAFNPWPGAYT